MQHALLSCAVMAFGIAAAPVAAQTATTYHGCTDAAGRTVAAVSDPSLPRVVASVDGAVPEIRYNENLLPRLLPESRTFLVAHECARHDLGLPLGDARVAQDARRADCHGLAALTRSGLLDESRLAAVERDLQFTDEEWRFVPGPKRSIDLGGCAAEGAARQLLIPPSSQRPEWNACVRACGERLRACGTTSAACDEAYDRCTSVCDFRSPP